MGFANAATIPDSLVLATTWMIRDIWTMPRAKCAIRRPTGPSTVYAALASKGLQSAPQTAAPLSCPRATRDRRLTRPRSRRASSSTPAIRLPTAAAKSPHRRHCLLRRREEVTSAGNLAASFLGHCKMRAFARCVSLSTGKTTVSGDGVNFGTLFTLCSSASLSYGALHALGAKRAEGDGNGVEQKQQCEEKVLFWPLLAHKGAHSNSGEICEISCKTSHQLSWKQN